MSTLDKRVSTGDNGNEDVTAREALEVTVAELQIAEEELRQQNEELLAARASLETERLRYRDLFELAPDGYLVTDSYGKIEFANLAAGDLLGVPSESLVGKLFATFIHADDRRRFRTRLANYELHSPSPPEPWEVRIQPRGRDSFFGSLRMALLRDDGTRPATLLWLLRDVSIQKQAEEAIRALNAELERRVAERTAELQAAHEHQEEYLRIITHDLRQPLTVLQGHAQMLAGLLDSAVVDTARARTSAVAIGHSAKRLASMIADLAETVRLEAGRLRLELETVDLGEFIRNTIDLTSTAEEKNRIAVKVPPADLVVRADRHRLERAIVNLVSNALKYSPPEKRITVAAVPSQTEVTVSVADEGVGIAPDDVPMMFQRFYRANTDKRTDGLGLGLYITRLIVESHGGRIWVESTPGAGSTFHFTLPRA